MPGASAIGYEDIVDAMAHVRARAHSPDIIILHPVDYDRMERLYLIIDIFGYGLHPGMRRIDFNMWVAPRLTLALRRLKMYRVRLGWWLRDKEGNDQWYWILKTLRSCRQRLRRASHLLRRGR